MANKIKVKQIDQTDLAVFINRFVDGVGGVYTADRVIISDSEGDVIVSSVTSSELAYVGGVTSAIQTQLDAKLTKTLADGLVFIGNASNEATAVALSGDITVSNAGVTTIGANKVTLAQMAQVATARILGRNTAGTGNVESLSASTVKSLLSLNLVENTALSTWAGTSNITTVGTLGSLTVNGVVNMSSATGYYAFNSVRFITARTDLTNYYFGEGGGNAGVLAAQTGDYNLGAGFAALSVITSGARNSVWGVGALQLATTASRWVAVGFTAGQYIVTGNNGVAIGYNALQGSGGDGSGSNNIGIGYQAGDALTTASNCLIIGYDVDAPSTTASNQMTIGNLLFSQGIDGTGTTLSTGNLGVGETAPGAKLHVTTNSASKICSIFKGAVSQSANLTEWQNSSATVLAKFDSAGVLTTAGYKSSDGSTGATGTATAVNTLTIKNGLVTNIA